jgi:hypothetical protein
MLKDLLMTATEKDFFSRRKGSLTVLQVRGIKCVGTKPYMIFVNTLFLIRRLVVTLQASFIIVFSLFCQTVLNNYSLYDKATSYWKPWERWCCK